MLREISDARQARKSRVVYYAHQGNADSTMRYVSVGHERWRGRSPTHALSNRTRIDMDQKQVLGSAVHAPTADSLQGRIAPAYGI